MISPQSLDHAHHLAAARASLEGLSVGDAFGERYFCAPDVARHMIAERALPAGTWSWTDDTAMALSVYDVLETFAGIDADALASRFADRYIADRMRGYGGGAHRLLSEIAAGGDWRELAPSLFGDGSYGNGAAMRVAPVGAYFHHAPELAVKHARLSALPTHAHPEGQAGAIAVAVAAGHAAAFPQQPWSASGMFDEVLRLTPPSEVRDRVGTVSELPGTTSPIAVAAEVGNGSDISAQDTVPFCLWAAAHHMHSFEEAMWATVSVLGDRDTTCAIVGGIVAARLGAAGIPMLWLHTRERIDVPWPTLAAE